MSKFYSALVLALHVSDLIGPSSGAFCTGCIRRLWYVVIRVVLDVSSSTCVSCWTAYILQDDTRTLQCQVLARVGFRTPDHPACSPSHCGVWATRLPSLLILTLRRCDWWTLVTFRASDRKRYAIFFPVFELSSSVCIKWFVFLSRHVASLSDYGFKVLATRKWTLHQLTMNK